MANRTVIKRVVAGFFLTLFMTYYANATLFGHCHVINGVTIVHSHFHSASHHSTPSGGHTESSLTLISALNNMIVICAGDILCGLVAFSVVCGCVPELRTLKPVVSGLPLHLLRAPPALQ